MPRLSLGEDETSPSVGSMTLVGPRSVPGTHTLSAASRLLREGFLEESRTLLATVPCGPDGVVEEREANDEDSSADEGDDAVRSAFGLQTGRADRGQARCRGAAQVVLVAGVLTAVGLVTASAALHPSTWSARSTGEALVVFGEQKPARKLVDLVPFKHDRVQGVDVGRAGADPLRSAAEREERQRLQTLQQVATQQEPAQTLRPQAPSRSQNSTANRSTAARSMMVVNAEWRGSELDSNGWESRRPPPKPHPQNVPSRSQPTQQPAPAERSAADDLVEFPAAAQRPLPEHMPSDDEGGVKRGASEIVTVAAPAMAHLPRSLPLLVDLVPPGALSQVKARRAVDGFGPVPSGGWQQADVAIGGSEVLEGDRLDVEGLEAAGTGISQWTVAYGGAIHVRESASLTATVLGKKWKCESVRGILEGDWVKLLDEPGYLLKESLEGAQLVKPYDPQEKCLNCSSFGEGCIDSQCCADSGYQCYKKHDTWAVCMTECLPGLNLFDVEPVPWTCEELGPRAPGAIPEPLLPEAMSDWVQDKCAKPGEDCSQSGCCVWEGMQCFRKHDTYAACKATCVPGPDLTDVDSDHWSCEKLGPRSPGSPAWWPSELADWVSEECASFHGDCTKSHCCSEPGVQCFAKDESYAECRHSCHPSDDDLYPWSCKKLGPIWTTTTTTTSGAAYDSLYCFTVSRSFGYERALMNEQWQSSVGIFGCDSSTVFCTEKMLLGSGKHQLEVVVFQSAVVGKSKDNTAGNALLFMNVWRALGKIGTWEQHDWTVKADPDAVFLPFRLREQIYQLRGKRLFVRNCDKVPSSTNPDWPMMFGALEVMSKQAVSTFLDGMEECVDQLPWKKWGEDLNMQKCLTHLGVDGVYQKETLGDELCTHVDCSDGSKAAYHPFKDWGAWNECWQNAMGAYG